MARLVRAIAIAAVIALGAGCSQAASPTAGYQTKTKTKTTEASDQRSKAVPLRLEPGMPPHVPVAKLTLDAGTHHVTQTGVLYAADWSTRRGVDKYGSGYPVPWPTVAKIDRTDDTTLAFDTPIAPEWIVVKAYAHVTGSHLIPEPRTAATYECLRYTEPRCHATKTATGIRIDGLGHNILTAAYIVVFCTWHVPLAEQRAESNTPDDVVASWIFHVNDKARLRVITY